MSLKPTPGGWFFHPYEIGIAGFSGAGKTTLAEKVLALLSADGIECGYVKRDAHFFEMDREGKDTWRAACAGAGAVTIDDRTHSALLAEHGPLGPQLSLVRQVMAPFSAVFVEGRKHLPIPKLLLLDPRDEADEKLGRGELSEVLAIVYPEGERERALRFQAAYPDASVVSRTDVDAILEVIRRSWRSRRPRLKGLVLAGGRSTRMGGDKAAIEYVPGISQARRSADLLASCCDEVYLSTRSGQRLPDDVATLPVIEDRYMELGPVGGILSAFDVEASTAWFVLSCDLPLLGAGDVAQLAAERNPQKLATCFGTPPDAPQGHIRADSSAESTNTGEIERLMPEPLAAIYEPNARTRILTFLVDGASCPRWILRNGGAAIVEPERFDALFNANDRDDYERARALLAESAGVRTAGEDRRLRT